MNPKLIFTAALPLLLCFLQTGESITCHQCTSYDEAGCDDPFQFADQPNVNKAGFLKPCEGDGEYFCRKIYQNVRGDERVIRSCGSVPHKVNATNCYKTVLEEYNTLVCQCFDDNCNSGSMLSMSVLAIVGSAILARLIQ
jgi:hypothetical protein